MILGIMRDIEGPLSRQISGPLSPPSLLALWCTFPSNTYLLTLIVVSVLEQLCP